MELDKKLFKEKVKQITQFVAKEKRLPRSGDKSAYQLYISLTSWRTMYQYEELTNDEIKLIESIPQWSWEKGTFGNKIGISQKQRFKMVLDFYNKWNMKPPTTTKAYIYGLRPLLEANKKNNLSIDMQTKLAELNLI